MLNSIGAEYLLIGGYAVNYYGSARSTGDMDIWVARDPENASKVASVLRDFGFAAATQEMLSAPDQIIRMGVPPLRLELLTSISGVASGRLKDLADLEEVRETRPLTPQNPPSPATLNIQL